jgi:SMI1/KNR4 family protein SUKH-1
MAGVDDDLIARLRERAADPKRRTDAPQSISLSGPGGTLTTMFGGLDSLLRTAGGMDPRAAGMTTDNTTALPPPAPEETLTAAERSLGFALPPGLRRLYLEVADGGFGPGGGLLSIAAAVDRYRSLQTGDELPRGRAWPANLLPIQDADPGCECLDVQTGEITGWDPEELAERVSDARWQRSFSTSAPSLEGWLTTWLEARPAHEVLQERLNASLVEEARKARAMIAAKTPAERAAMGLPEVGWEQVVWGGIGLEDDASDEAPRDS